LCQSGFGSPTVSLRVHFPRPLLVCDPTSSLLLEFLIFDFNQNRFFTLLYIFCQGMFFFFDCLLAILGMAKPPHHVKVAPVLINKNKICGTIYEISVKNRSRIYKE
uniref:Uncharacterized protein n=1 Tax=Anolis carolinensis TaxID=28377 RepID=A0A803TVR2_ANOCA